MRTGLLVVVVAAMAVALAAPAAAQDTPANWEVCENVDLNHSPEEQAAGCTALIKSGTLNSFHLAAALELRGLSENLFGRTPEGDADIARAKAIEPNIDK